MAANASLYTTSCKNPGCGRRISIGQPCPYCAGKKQSVGPFPVSEVIQSNDEVKKKVNQQAFSLFGGFLFIAILSIMLIFAARDTTWGQTLIRTLLGSIEKAIPVLYPSATPTPFLPSAPPQVKYLVEKCAVEGSDADRVNCYKTEMRQVGESWLTQFQADDGSFVEEALPSFNGLDFLLVCIPKELGPAWAEAFGETFFAAIGTRPINPTTGTEDTGTIAEGFWLFANPEKFRADEPTPAPATHTPLPESAYNTPPIGLTPNVVVQTATPTATLPSPDEVVSLGPISMYDLLNGTETGMEVWNLNGVDSVEVTLEYDAAMGVNAYVGWAPSKSEPQYWFTLWDLDVANSYAAINGCSTGWMKDSSPYGAWIYEGAVGRKIVNYDQAGIGYWIFPSGKTSLYPCLVWPTATPRPFTPTPTATAGPGSPTPTLSPPEYACDVNLKFWDVVANPSLITGSGNQWIAQWTIGDSSSWYYGSMTGASIHYCLTEKPNSIEGVDGKIYGWDGRHIAFGQSFDPYPVILGEVREVQMKVNPSIWLGLVSLP